MDRIPPNPNNNLPKAPAEGSSRSIFKHIQRIISAAGEAMRAVVYEMQPYHPNESAKVLLDRLVVSPNFIEKLSDADKIEIIQSAQKEVLESDSTDAILAGLTLLFQFQELEEAQKALVDDAVIKKLIKQIRRGKDIDSRSKILQQLIEIAKLPNAPLNKIAGVLKSVVTRF